MLNAKKLFEIAYTKTPNFVKYGNFTLKQTGKVFKRKFDLRIYFYLYKRDGEPRIGVCPIHIINSKGDFNAQFLYQIVPDKKYFYLHLKGNREKLHPFFHKNAVDFVHPSEGMNLKLFQSIDKFEDFNIVQVVYTDVLNLLQRKNYFLYRPRGADLLPLVLVDTRNGGEKLISKIIQEYRSVPRRTCFGGVVIIGRNTNLKIPTVKFSNRFSPLKWDKYLKEKEVSYIDYSSIRIRFGKPVTLFKNSNSDLISFSEEDNSLHFVFGGKEYTLLFRGGLRISHER